MRNNPYQRYANDEILTADPVRLVQLLYRGAADAVADARAKLATGDVKGRSAAITKAVEILTELGRALDHERGGELSARLAALYDYMQQRLLAANFDQVDAPLAEVDRLLGTLLEAWLEIEAPETAAPVRRNNVDRQISRMPVEEYTPAEDYVPLSCAY